MPRHQRLVRALESPRASTMRLLRNRRGAGNVIQVRVTMAGAVLCDRFAGLSTHSTQWGRRESYQGSQITGRRIVAAAAHETIILEGGGAG